MPPAQPARYRRVHLPDLPAVRCPCGMSRRAFGDAPELPATIHLTNISLDARTHYHRAHTETYYVLSCANDARIELDDQIVPVRPGTCVMIPPGVRHRAIGHMQILNIVLPKFDPADEHFD